MIACYRLARGRVGWILGMFLLLLGKSAAAEPDAREKAAAEGLFQQATLFMDQGKHAEACAKFEGSQELDPALGTVLRLADCYDRIGRTASAWALFQEAAASARASNQLERERIATQRASDLAARLSRIEFFVPVSARVEGLSIRLNGALIPSASWDARIPVDPGIQSILATAPNHRSWSTRLEVPAGPVTKKLELPGLSPTPRAAPESPSQSNLREAPLEKPSGGRTAQTIGYLTGGLGALGVIAGGLLGYRAYALNDDSLGQCRSNDPNTCTVRGKSLRDDAQSAALASTIVVAGGAALLATGASLVLLTPRTEDKKKTSLRLRIRSAVLKRGARFSLQGEF